MEVAASLGGAGNRRLLAGRVALVIYAFGILAIGLSADWRLQHEDNGAFSTTLAMSHLRLGLAQTRAHDLFYNPHTGETAPLGHHPPGLALTLAGAFALTGSDSPAIARLAMIVFQLGTVLLTTALLSAFVDAPGALLGGFVMATLPMGGYFGRIVNYEPPSFFFVMLVLYGYVLFKSTGRPSGLMWLSTGIVGGGLMDWPSFFFCAALAAIEAVDLILGQASTYRLLGVLVACSGSMFVFDLWHLWYAARGSMHPFQTVLSRNHQLWDHHFTVLQFAWGQVGTFKRWFSWVGLIATLMAAAGIALPDALFSKRFFDVRNAALCRRLLLATGAAASAYVVAAPDWARVHQYWQFYFLPLAVIAMVLLWRFLQHLTIAPMLRRGLQLACLVDVLGSSAFELYRYHTRVGEYAVVTTAMLRATYLTPRSLPATDPSTAPVDRRK